MRDGKMPLERAWGVADIEKNVSASKVRRTVRSVTKQFTAALVLKQVDRGRTEAGRGARLHAGTGREAWSAPGPLSDLRPTR